MSMFGGILGMGRQIAEAKMEDECVVSRNSESELNEATGLNETSTSTIYEGICEVLLPYRAPQSAKAPGQVETIQLARLSLPVSKSPGIVEGDRITITKAAHDPDLVGKVFKVKGGHHQTHATARRLPIEEYT